MEQKLAVFSYFTLFNKPTDFNTPKLSVIQWGYS